MSSTNTSASPRTALIHEWLVDWGGSESVTAEIARLLPSPPDLYALIDHLPVELRERLPVASIRTSPIQGLPFSRRRFWYYLPLMPEAVERFNLNGYERIVSSSHAFAKGVLTGAEQFHLSYVHSPMRYAWDLHHQYLDDYGLARGLRGWLAGRVFSRLRRWDRQTANNVDLFVANSQCVARRIWRVYRRHARVIHPPVDIDALPFSETKSDVYVTVSRLVSYKRVDAIVEAFRELPRRKLVVIGNGPEMNRIAARCPPNVELLGYQPDAVVRAHLAAARAFVFAAEEDFGITPVEAQACGTPVIAFRGGGALETVRDGITGVFFDEQSPRGVRDGIARFEALSRPLAPYDCRANAEPFSRERFAREFSTVLDTAYESWRRTGPQNLDPRE